MYFVIPTATTYIYKYKYIYIWKYMYLQRGREDKAKNPVEKLKLLTDIKIIQKKKGEKGKQGKTEKQNGRSNPITPIITLNTPIREQRKLDWI